MLCPCVTENGWPNVNCQMSEHNRRWWRPYDLLVEATHGEIVVRVHHTNLIAMEMTLGGDMVQLIVVEWFEAIQHTWEKSCEGRDHAKRGSATQKRSVGQKGGGLGGVPQCHRGGSTDREERDADARQRIVGPWAWQHYGTAGSALVVKGAEEVEN
ncbi:hypothetical protein B296_00042481 [Ensete ventricosum]|uniref:Uncharacterized protein n=1 Tax=Ensete ventricosum TaxID=4639 RepID=A0A426X729_ENSVE|nr:hypothetical protein B296_00042481 [Ensete ventricosum]